MMILGQFRCYALGALLAGLAAPSLAGAADAQVATDTRPMTSAGSQSAEASRPRRVELPFPLDVNSPDREPRASATQGSAQDGSGPHPFRETQLKRASLVDPASGAAANFDRRLSRFPDFS